MGDWWWEETLSGWTSLNVFYSGWRRQEPRLVLLSSGAPFGIEDIIRFVFNCPVICRQAAGAWIKNAHL